MALASRVATAIVGGYALTAIVTSLIARLLPGAKSDASAWALNISFALYAAILLWAFTSRRPARTAVIVCGGSLLLAGLLRGLGPHA
jgi:hypothetical protein